jgi:hypothetical protein
MLVPGEGIMRYYTRVGGRKLPARREVVNVDFLIGRTVGEAVTYVSGALPTVRRLA